MRRTLQSWNSRDGNKLDKKSNTRQPPSTVAPSQSTSSSQTQNTQDQQPATSDVSTDYTVHVQVGSQRHRRSFRLSKTAISEVSSLFGNATKSPTANDIDLPNDDPIAFNLFIEWLELQDSHVPYEPLCYSAEPWRSKAAEAWVLARHIKSKTFEMYALSQFTVNCALNDLSTWEFIEREVQEQSSLRQFSNHWIAWNCWLASPGPSEYAGLKGARFQSVVNDDTRDPRIYDLHHWYSPCGAEITPSCSHDPITQKNKIETANQAGRPKYKEWGRDWETENQSSPPKDTIKP